MLLYALRYQKHPNNDVKGLVMALRKKSVPDSSLKVSRMMPFNQLAYARYCPQCIATLLEYGGSQARQSDLFESELPQDVSSIKRRFFKGIKGVDNVYTQHKPLLVETVNALLKGRLRENLYPVCGGSAAAEATGRVQAIHVFVVGGVTHEEAHAIHVLNTTSPGVKIYLGGTSVLNSQSFFEVVDAAMEGMNRRVLRIAS